MQFLEKSFKMSNSGVQFTELQMTSAKNMDPHLRFLDVRPVNRLFSSTYSKDALKEA